MNDVLPYYFQDNTVRILSIDGQPWFVARDVCSLFGDTNHSRSVGRVSDEDKTAVEVIDSMGRAQTAIAINESGLYSLLFQMMPQKANNDGVSDAYPIETIERIEKLNRFKKWVTGEVLPSIRKTGQYSIVGDSRKLMALALVEAHKMLEEQLPLVEFAEAVRGSKDGKYIREIAKALKPETGEKRLYQFLRDRGIFIAGTREPFQSFIDRGYFVMKPSTWQDSEGNEHISYTPLVTGKGQIYIEKLWRENNEKIIEMNREARRHNNS